MPNSREWSRAASISVTAPKAVDTLSGEFDLLLAGMQKPAARARMKAAFDGSPKRLGRAAAAAARKR